MSFYVKGMPAPKSCRECPMVSIIPDALAGYLFCCRLDYSIVGSCETREKSENCHIIEIPSKHGRLIDADALNIYDISPAYGFSVMGVTEEDINQAPTVIEPEE